MTANAGANAGTYTYCYDAHTKTSPLVDSATATIAAQYEYGPFGEVIRATGPMAKVNPFMFSTKFYDWETGLLYYGYRFYNPATGRFLNRDPMAERGGLNLYLFVNNSPITLFDKLGREPGDSEGQTRPPFSDIMDSVKDVLKKLPKDQVEKYEALYKKAQDIKSVYDEAKEANEVNDLVVAILKNGDQDAFNDLVGKVGQAALKDALKACGAPDILAVGIIDGAQLGTALGDSIANQLKAYANAVGCNACKCGAMIDDVGTGEYTVNGGAGTKYRCYKSKDGNIFSYARFTDKDIKNAKGFFGNLVAVFGATDGAWKFCGQ